MNDIQSIILANASRIFGDEKKGAKVAIPQCTALNGTIIGYSIESNGDGTVDIKLHEFRGSQPISFDDKVTAYLSNCRSISQAAKWLELTIYLKLESNKR